MSLARARRVDPLLLVVGFVTILLFVLGFLQYRWTGELSEAERGRLRAGLRMRAELLAQDLDREVTRAFLRLQLDPATLRDHDFTAYADRYEGWRALAPEPGLVKDVYFAEAGSGDALRLLRYAPEERTFGPVEWPKDLAAARDRALVESPAGRMARGFRPGPLNQLEDGTPLLVAPAPSFDRSPAGPPGPPSPGRGPMGGGFAVRLAGFTVIVLDKVTLTEKLLPKLEGRYFPRGDDPAFALRVTRQDRPADVLYASPAGSALPVHAEAAVGLLELRFDEANEEDLRMVAPPWGPRGERRPPGDHPGFGERRPPGDRPGFGGRMMRGRGREGRAGLWTLEVAPRGGSVDTLVAGARQRNLLVGFSVLLLLGTSTLLLALSARRAERLAARQMEFVAAVSHELRTPVSVICSAGENLADGLVQGREGVARYGTLVRDEGRRLARLVEQVLDFAGTYSGKRPYKHEPVVVARLVEEALEAAGAALKEAGTRVERDVAADLPEVLGDGPALARALRNLIENAVKYGGDERLVAVRARSSERAGRRWVRLEVEDHGLGIPPAEQKHLFEPFWRGPSAVDRQIRGSGLGLALVQSIVSAHGGEVNVSSEPGRGSVFALELPAAMATVTTSGAREESRDDIPHTAG